MTDVLHLTNIEARKGMICIMGERVACRLNCTINFVLLSVLFVVIVPGVFGQSNVGQSEAGSPAANAVPKLPVFDVMSVRPNKSGTDDFNIDSNDSSYTATGITLKMLFEKAYGIREDLIYGLPNWANSERFDIKAKIVEPDLEALKKLTPEQRRLMLQPLLSDWFKLKVHTETRVLSVFDMVAVKGEPKFKESTPEGSPEDKSSNGIGRGGMSAKNGVLIAHAIPLASLANMLARWLQQTVIDKTGLTGRYDLILKWAPEHGPDASSEASRTSLFTALKEQLGLKLQDSRGPVETLVVDHVEMPSEN